MTWPTAQIAEGSAAQVWNRICGDLLQAKRTAEFLRTMATRGELRPVALRRTIPELRAVRVYLNANDNVAGVEAYGRLVSGDPAFNLTAESAALKAALQAVISEGRALHNASTGDLAADGTATEPVEFIAPANAAVLIAACTALEALIN